MCIIVVVCRLDLQLSCNWFFQPYDHPRASDLAPWPLGQMVILWPKVFPTHKKHGGGTYRMESKREDILWLNANIAKQNVTCRM